MVRNSQTWELGEPELNKGGKPVIHDIAQKLDCIRSGNSTIPHGRLMIPDDKAAMLELAGNLQAQQAEYEQNDFGQTDNNTEDTALSDLSPTDTKSMNFEFNLMTDQETDFFITDSPSSPQIRIDQEWPAFLCSKSLLEQQQFEDLMAAIWQQSNLPDMEVQNQGPFESEDYPKNLNIFSSADVNWQDEH